MNIGNYTNEKAAGRVKVERYGKDFQISKRRFNPETGEETTPEVEAFSRDQIQKQLETHQKAVIDITAFLNDLDSLEAK